MKYHKFCEFRKRMRYLGDIQREKRGKQYKKRETLLLDKPLLSHDTNSK